VDQCFANNQPISPVEIKNKALRQLAEGFKDLG
jgi:hypothetical protein